MSRSILIVEDDENIAELLGCFFAHEGLEPVVVRDRRAAEEHVAAQPPAAAVVLDLTLPDHDGFAVAQAIRTDPRWRDVPVVIVSARALGSNLERGRAVRVAAYVTKPFRPSALVERVKGLLVSAAA